MITTHAREGLSSRALEHLNKQTGLLHTCNMWPTNICSLNSPRILDNEQQGSAYCDQPHCLCQTLLCIQKARRSQGWKWEKRSASMERCPYSFPAFSFPPSSSFPSPFLPYFRFLPLTSGGQSKAECTEDALVRLRLWHVMTFSGAVYKFISFTYWWCYLQPTYSNASACQLLSNMCVMLIYRQGSTAAPTACDLYFRRGVPQGPSFSENWYAEEWNGDAWFNIVT